jgi:O-antigen/teichoic acid export membrane protein
MEFAVRSIRLLGYRAVTVIVAALISVVTARWLGPEGLGVYWLIVFGSGLAVTVLGGVGSAIAYQISNRGRPPREVVATALALAVGVGLVALLLLGTIYLVSGDPSLWWLPVIGGALPLLLASSALTWALLGADDHRNYNRAILAPSALTLLFLVLLLGPGQLANGGDSSVRLALTAWLLAQAGTVLWLLWIGRHDWLPPALQAITPAGIGSIALFGLQTGLADVVSLLNYRVDVFILGLLKGPADAGIYTIAVQIADALWVVSSAIGVAIYARVGQLQRREAAALTARSMRHALFILTILGIGAMILPSFVFPILFGDEYSGAIAPTRLLVPGIVIFGLGRIFSTFFTNGLGRPRIPLLIAATSLVICTVLSFALIPPFGMNGAAVATTVSYIVSMLLAIAIFSRETGIPPRRMLILTGDDLRDYAQVARRLLAKLPSAGGRAVRGEP